MDAKETALADTFIHLAIAFDANYYNAFCALLASVQHHHPKGSVFFHVIATGVDPEKLDDISQHVKRFRNSIKYYAIDDSRLHQLITMSTWTSAVYYRLYFALLVGDNVSRLLYLDSDTLVINNLESLYNLPLDGCPVAAVYDIYVGRQPLIGIENDGEYFNSGVLLIDVRVWREQNISEKTIRYLLDFPERIKFVDQCALNAVLRNNWKKINEKYNLLYSYIPQEMSGMELDKFISDKAIIHFTLQRPWQMLSKNRLRKLYFRYLKRSGLQKGKSIIDFSVQKIPALVSVRVKEFYNDHLLLKKFWRSIKKGR